MKRFFLTVLALVCAAGEARAQNENLDIIPEPICFQLRNASEYTVNGTVSTDSFTRPDGIRTRHRANFRFQPAGSVDDAGEPRDRKTFCSSGPFYPDRKLDIQIKTLVPVFNCKTRIDQGEIIIDGRPRPDGSGVDMIINCFD